MANGSKMLEKHIKAMKSVANKSVQVGWFESDRYGATEDRPVGQSVAKVARTNEFGGIITEDGRTAYIPPRPFMRGALAEFARNRTSIEPVIFGKAINGQITSDQALAQIGSSIEGFILRSLKHGNWQRNAPYTIAKKGFDSPLTETGHMAKTISSKVV